MFKQVANQIVHSRLGDHFMNLLEQSASLQPDLLQVLTYHEILDADGFNGQMAYLSTYYHVISMPELLDACRSGSALRPGSVMVTFDDAYLNFAECAWPIMKQHDVPVTLFVPTAFPDNPHRIFWWDRLYYALQHTPRSDSLETAAGRFPLGTARQRDQAYRRIRDYLKTLPYSELLSGVHEICTALEAPPATQRVLGWDALRQLAEEGVTLGAHTRRHRYLNELAPEEIEEEVGGSLQDLERELGSVLPIFAYPDGRFGEEAVEALERAGVALAFTTIRGTNHMKKTDRLRLRRNNIGSRGTIPILRARLLQASLQVGHPG